MSLSVKSVSLVRSALAAALAPSRGGTKMYPASIPVMVRRAFERARSQARTQKEVARTEKLRSYENKSMRGFSSELPATASAEGGGSRTRAASSPNFDLNQ